MPLKTSSITTLPRMLSSLLGESPYPGLILLTFSFDIFSPDLISLTK